jgi:hypothetical protein
MSRKLCIVCEEKSVLAGIKDMPELDTELCSDCAKDNLENLIVKCRKFQI